MIHSKSIDILRTFSKADLKHFSDFVRSPFHNKNKNLIKLFDALVKYHPEYDAENEKIFSKIYPGKVYSHDIMKKLMSELHKLSDIFLSYVGIRKEKFIFKKTLLKELSSRKVDDYYQLVMKNSDKDFPEEYPEYYNNKSILEGFKTEFSLTRNIPVDFIEIHNNKFSYDTCYYLFQALMYLECTTSLKNSYSKMKSNSNLDRLFLNFDFDSFINNSVLETDQDKTMYLICNLMQTILCPKEESYFFNSKKMFLELFNKDTQEIRDDYSLYFAVLTSSCTRKMRERDLKYCNDQFELYKHKIRVIENSQTDYSGFSWTEFSNTVVAATSLDEIEWAEEFIVKIKKYIHPKNYDYLYNYGKSIIELNKGNFEKSLECTSKIYFKDHPFKVALININLMCYYELELYEAAHSAIDSFNHQILNSDRYNLRYKSLSKYFIDIYKKTLKLKENPEKITDWNIKEINIMLLEKEYSNSDKWFLKKLDELKAIKVLTSKIKKNYYQKIIS